MTQINIIDMCSPSDAAKTITVMQQAQELLHSILTLSRVSGYYKLQSIPFERMVRYSHYVDRKTFNADTQGRVDWARADHTHLLWLIEYAKELIDNGGDTWNYMASDAFIAFHYWLRLNEERLKLMDKENCPVPIEERDGFPFAWKEPELTH